MHSSLLYVLQLKEVDTPANPNIIKLSSDGAWFSKSSSFVFFSFSFSSLSSNVLAASGMLYMYSSILNNTMLHVITLGNHTFAAVKGSEGYEHMFFTLHDVFKEINTLRAAGKILVCDQLI